MTLNKTKSTIATGSEFLMAQQGFNQNNLHLKMYKKNQNNNLKYLDYYLIILKDIFNDTYFND